MFEKFKNCFFDGVFLSIYSNIFSISYSFISYVEKKLWGSKNSENGLFQKSHPIRKETYFFVFLLLFPLQDNNYFFWTTLNKKFYRVIEKDDLSKTNINACEYVGDECRTVIGDIKEILQ